jgi:hypothetical protein
MTCLGVSKCSSYVAIKFDPIWYVGDYKNRGIVNRFGHFVSAEDEAFNNYSCLSEDKLKEILDILQEAKIPKRVRDELLKRLSVDPIEP